MKITMSFTIDKEVAEEFNEITTEKFINKSELVGSFIKKWVKENSKNHKQLQKKDDRNV